MSSPRTSKVKDKTRPLKFRRQSDGSIFKKIRYRDLKGKLRTKVKPGWSHRLNKLIWNELRLPCAWSFKRANFRAKKNDVHVTGHCADCSAAVQAFHKMNNNRIKVRITGFQRECQHKSKRHVTMQVKSQISGMLEGNSAYAVQSKLADAAMNEGDPTPAHIPNLSGLR